MWLQSRERWYSGLVWRTEITDLSLMAQLPATVACDSDAPYIPQVYGIKNNWKKKRNMAFQRDSSLHVQQDWTSRTETYKNSIRDYEEHLKLLSWMWFKKEESTGIKWNQMSALLKLESRSRGEHAWVWGRAIKTVSQRFDSISEKTKCWEQERIQERGRQHHSGLSQISQEAPEKETD